MRGQEAMAGHSDRGGKNTACDAASEFVAVSCGPDGFHLSLERALEQHLGLRLRPAEVRHCMESALTQSEVMGRFDDAGECVLPSSETGTALARLIRNIDTALSITASRPFTPRLVQNALGITGQERLRWTKHGRLRTCGFESFRRGHHISVPTYAVEHIEQLLADPRIIAGWREEDRLARQGATE